MTFPDFKLPIEDRNAAEFWRDEWRQRFHETKDYAFQEAADAMRRFIDDEFWMEDEDEWI